MSTQVATEGAAVKNGIKGRQAADVIKYEASGARKTLLSIVFVLLLPFYLSLPVMLFSRAAHGLWKDTVGLGVLGLAFTAIMVILFLQLLFAVRARVSIGKQAVAITLPKGRGPTPMLFYNSRRIPFDEIAEVETRREIYGAPLAPVLMRGARLITKDDEKIPLGYVNEYDVDTFPVMIIANKIAERAGINVKDEGAVRRSVRAKALGKKHRAEYAEPLSDEEIARVNRQHRRVLISSVIALGALLAIGIAIDVFLT